MNDLARFNNYKEAVEALNDTFSYNDGDLWIKRRLGTLISDINSKIKIEESLEKQKDVSFEIKH